MRPGVGRFVLLFVGVASAFAGCTRPEDTRRLLESQGYTDVDAGGWAFLDCSEDDWFRTRFTATSPTAQPVTGAVCAGLLFKNATIRFGAVAERAKESETP